MKPGVKKAGALISVPCANKSHAYFVCRLTHNSAVLWSRARKYSQPRRQLTLPYKRPEDDTKLRLTMSVMSTTAKQYDIL